MKYLLLVLLISLAQLAFAQPGTFNSTFSNDGIDTFSMNSGRVYSMSLQKDGKIVVGGDSSGFGVLVRYNIDGSRDNSFGINGMVVANYFPKAIALQSNGKIVAAGGGSVVRFNTDGSFDVTFGLNGRIITPSGMTTNAMVVQNDGKIVIAGYNGNSFALARYNNDGSTDTGFGNQGTVVSAGSNSAANAMALQTDGKIVIAGDTYSGGISVARYNTDGSPDNSFDNDGFVLTQFSSPTDPPSGSANGIDIQADGKIVVAGNHDKGGGRYRYIALVRYNTDGSTDLKVSTYITGSYDIINAIRIQSDNKIVLAGYAATPTYTATGRLMVARLKKNGTFNSSFNGNGYFLTWAAGGGSRTTAMQLGQNRIYVAGSLLVDLSPYKYCTVALKNDGLPQTINPPVITGFTPEAGPVGTPVIITGTNFNATAANNIVYLGAVRATVTGATETSLTIIAPAGATYAPLSILDNSTGLTAYSAKPFMVTFNNPFVNGIPTNFYQPKISFNATGTIQLGDIDGDGKPDIVTGSDVMSVLRNTSLPGNSSLSAASFAPKVDFAVTNSGFPRAFAIGDVDGDGKPDIVAANYNDGSVSVLRNTSVTGSITATSFAPEVKFVTDRFPVTLALADIDGDGRPEILTGNVFSVSVLRNITSPGIIDVSSFAAKIDITGVSGNSEYYNSYLKVSDIDGDGKPDLVVNSDQPYVGARGSIALFRNTSTTGSISTASFAAPVYFKGDQAIAIGDLDKDGKPDIVVGSTAGYATGPNDPFTGKVLVYRNAAAPGTINQSSLEPYILFRPRYNAYAVEIADLDGDSKPEIITGDLSTSLSVLRNTSTPGSITGSSFAPRVDLAGGSWSIAAGDIDADGIPELFATGGYLEPGTISAYKITNTFNQVTFSGKVYLQGAYNTASASMDNTLNSRGILQASAAVHPYAANAFKYAGSEKVGNAFYDAHPDIVDWVLVELRSAATPSNVLATRAAFVKQDGSLADIDGETPHVLFQGFMPGNYHIAIRHRNHLGIRSSSAIDFSSGSGTYDFTNAASQCYQNQNYSSTVPVGNIYAMRAGNANSNNNVKFNGPDNDQDRILNGKLGGSLSTILNNEYAAEDVNMDGTVKANGPGNDPNFLLNIILGGLLSTIYNEQL